MKKTIALVTCSIALVAISCTSKPAETKKETIVVTPAPAQTTVVKPPPPTTEKPATKVVLNKNGAKVETKKVDVTINQPK